VSNHHQSTVSKGDEENKIKKPKTMMRTIPHHGYSTKWLKYCESSEVCRLLSSDHTYKLSATATIRRRTDREKRCYVIP
jgi:hypothetical protein